MASGVPTHALNALVTSELDKDNTFSLHAFAPLLIILIIEIIIEYTWFFFSLRATKLTCIIIRSMQKSNLVSGVNLTSLVIVI